MKKIISFLIVTLLLVTMPMVVLANEDESKNNVCLGKPVLLSTRYEFSPVYVNNIVDGDMYTRSSTMPQNSLGNYQWFQIDLCANYVISEVVLEIVPGCDGDPKSLAIDVYSDGKWVRVAQKYNLEADDYPMSLYFEEIECSYIRVATNELTEPEADRSFVGFSEIQAYYTKNISDKEIKDSFMDVPDDKVEIPMPTPVNSFFFKQGERSDYSVAPTIDENALIVTEVPYDRCSYTEQDEEYAKSLEENIVYKSNDSKGAGELAVDWNQILLIVAIGLLVSSSVFIGTTIVIMKKKTKKINLEV